MFTYLLKEAYEKGTLVKVKTANSVNPFFGWIVGGSRRQQPVKEKEDFIFTLYRVKDIGDIISGKAMRECDTEQVILDDRDILQVEII